MPVFWLFLCVLAIAVIGSIVGRARAMQSAGGDSRTLHSLPSYYSANVGMWVITPAFAVMLIWLLAQPIFINNRVATLLPDTAISEDTTLGLVMSDVRRVANGLDLAVAEGEMTPDEASSIRSELTDVRERLAAVGVALGSNVSPEVLLAAQRYRQLSSTGSFLMAIAVLATAIVAL